MTQTKQLEILIDERASLLSELKRIEAKRDLFLTVAETVRLFWLRDRKAAIDAESIRLRAGIAEGERPALTEHQLSRINSSHKARCDVCGVWTDIDDIVWRGSDGKLAVCDECEPEGDDCR